MKRSMHNNSLEAHKENITFGKYPKQIKAIIQSLQFIERGTMHNIANHLQVPLNTISGRFKRMREDGIIKEDGKTNNKTIWKLCKTI